LGDYLMTTGDRAGAAAVLRAAADDEQARGWVRWYLSDEWYSRNCPTLAAMGKQINAVRAKIGAKSGAMTDELWREDA
jgi:ABC-type Fe3+ transport system substrate-binding protein